MIKKYTGSKLYGSKITSIEVTQLSMKHINTLKEMEGLLSFDNLVIYVHITNEKGECKEFTHDIQDCDIYDLINNSYIWDSFLCDYQYDDALEVLK